MKKKLIGQAKLVGTSIRPQALSSGTTNGTLIDRLGFLDSIVHLNVGAVTGAPTTQSVTLQIQAGDAADGSDQANVANVNIPAITANNTDGYIGFDLTGCGRYIRPVVTVAFTGGTTPTIPVAVTVALGTPDVAPVS